MVINAAYDLLFTNKKKYSYAVSITNKDIPFNKKIIYDNSRK